MVNQATKNVREKITEYFNLACGCTSIMETEESLKRRREYYRARRKREPTEERESHSWK